MGKVYFDKEKYGIWVVEDLEDYYTFKAVNFETNEESSHILSWSRNYNTSDMGSNNVVDRIYDVEIDEEKYYFLFINNGEGWDVISEDSIKLEKLLKDTNLFFTGEVKIVE
jgi:hypothetical protein